MKVNEKATRAARERQAKGVRSLTDLFGFTTAKEPFNPHTGRAISKDRIVRLRWRQWRDSTFPPRVLRRRRRKLARVSRKRNRA